MSRATRAFVSMVGVLLLGSAVAFFAWWRAGATPSRAPSLDLPLLEDELVGVERIDLAYPAYRVSLRRRPEGWFAHLPTTPVGLRAGARGAVVPAAGAGGPDRDAPGGSAAPGPSRVMKAAEPEVAQLLEALRGARVRRRWRAGDSARPSLTAAGLAPAQQRVVVWRSGPRPGETLAPIELRFGATSPYNRQRYLHVVRGDDGAGEDLGGDDRARDGDVVMVAQTWAARLTPDPITLLDRRVLGAGPEQILRIDVQRAGADAAPMGYTLVRLEGPPAPDQEAVSSSPRAGSRREHRHSFAVQTGSGGPASRGGGPREGEPRPADGDAVDAFLRMFTATPVSQFLHFDHGGRWAEFGLDEPAFWVRATVTAPAARPDSAAARPDRAAAGQGRPPVVRQLRVGPVRTSAEGVSTVIVARQDPPWVGEVNAALYFALAQEGARFEERALMRFSRDQVTRVEFTAPGVPPQVWRRGAPGPAGKAGAWQDGGTGEALPALEVQQVLMTFSDLVATAREPAGPGEDTTGWLARTGCAPGSGPRIAFWGEAGASLGALRIGAVSGDDLFVLREDAGFIGRVPATKLRALPTAFRPAPPPAAAP